MVQTGASEQQFNVEQLMLCMYLVYLLINSAKSMCHHCKGVTVGSVTIENLKKNIWKQQHQMICFDDFIESKVYSSTFDKK